MTTALAVVCELRLHDGDQITVEGRLTEELIPELGYRGVTARVLRGQPGAPVVITLR